MTAPTTVRFKGRPLTLGGVTYTVPPLSLGAFEDFEERMRDIGNLSPIEQLRLTLDLAQRAFNRNYPEMTREDLRELIDVQTAPEIYAVIIGASVPEPTPGESGAMVSGTGLPSTPTSPPVSDGPSSTAASESPSTS